jgi:hypothetical protein
MSIETPAFIPAQEYLDRRNSAPAPKRPIAMVVFVLTALVAIGVLSFALIDQQGQTESARDQVTSLKGDVTSLKGDLADTKAELTTTQDDLSTTQDDLAEANDTIERCSVFPGVAGHLLSANEHLLNAVDASIFVAIDEMGAATRELEKGTRLLESDGSAEGELWALCESGASGSNV